MSPQQTEHFKKILFSWKKMLMSEAEKTMDHMKQDSSKLSDPNDAATQEEEICCCDSKSGLRWLCEPWQGDERSRSC